MHVRGHMNVAKRALIQVAGFNLGLLMRKLFNVGKPRMLQGARAAIAATMLALLRVLMAVLYGTSRSFTSRPPSRQSHEAAVRCALTQPSVAFTTGC